MIWIVLIALFILQLVGFYIIALLYTKVSKFDDLERKQRKLMNEMDDSIAAYLSEVKDENERLVELLGRHDELAAARERVKPEPTTSKKEDGSTLPLPIQPPKIPINLAIKSYSNSAEKLKNGEVADSAPKSESMDTRSQIFRLYDAGLSEEEIAKKLGKGRTEVELILKFR
ncbi:hypothetical protein AB1K83_01065 [Sporosarcina sp. 179-K 3D1 HS]|uniref:DUF6115 domain-containing protein n=1 Tax=Sporosarcina sp. 179-K 3D1 HS TaxID=3232169 RepID=UPI0039A29732